MVFSHHLLDFVSNVVLMHVFSTIRYGAEAVLMFGDAVVLVATIVLLEKRLPWWAVIPASLFVTPIAIIMWDFAAVMTMTRLNLFVG